MNDTQQKQGQWLSTLVRGVLFQHPISIKAYGHRDCLYVKAMVVKQSAKDLNNLEESDVEEVDLCFSNAPNFSFLLDTRVEIVDFKNTWPPHELIQEQIGPKLILPGQIRGKINEH